MAGSYVKRTRISATIGPASKNFSEVIFSLFYFSDLSNGKMQELDISADMPFSLVISTLRRKRLMTILTSKERNKQEGKDVIATYK